MWSASICVAGLNLLGSHRNSEPNLLLKGQNFHFKTDANWKEMRMKPEQLIKKSICYIHIFKMKVEK